MSNFKKAINFDLSTKKLKEYYPMQSYKRAYSDVKKFMLENGFKHRQWSGYISSKPISQKSVRTMINKMNKEMPWLKHCVNRFDVTNVGKSFDMSHMFASDTNKAISVPANSMGENLRQEDARLARREAEQTRMKEYRESQKVKVKAKDKGLFL